LLKYQVELQKREKLRNPWNPFRSWHWSWR
jgi:hypothetical protein